MSFLDEYIKNNQLSPLDESVKRKLVKIETRLNNRTLEEKSSDIVKDHSSEILKIINKIKHEFAGWSLSVGNVVSAFRFVLDIGEEVAKIVNKISYRITSEQHTPEERKQAKILFGQELVYFIYLTWNPRLLKWVPLWIESIIEKKIVYWLAGMAIDRTLSQIEEK